MARNSGMFFINSVNGQQMKKVPAVFRKNLYEELVRPSSAYEFSTVRYHLLRRCSDMLEKAAEYRYPGMHGKAVGTETEPISLWQAETFAEMQEEMIRRNRAAS